MNQFSDSESPDSDDGRRFKTDSTRPKKDNSQRIYSRHRSYSPCRKANTEKQRKSRSRSPKYDRSKRHGEKSLFRKEEYRGNSKYKEKRERQRTKPENGSSTEKNSDKKKDREECFKSVPNNLDGSSDPSVPSFEGREDNVKEMKKKFELYGPALPPSLPHRTKDIVTGRQECASYGPILPPTLPKHEGIVGMCPPPADIVKEKTVNEEKVIGPDLPQYLRESLAKPNTTVPSESEDDDIIGPLPPEAIQSKAHIALEERALQIKINSLGDAEAEVKKREDWMIELPAVRSAGINLGPRQFRSNPGPDMSDRSSWTDTPEDKMMKRAGESSHKVDVKKEAELKEVRKRDEEQEMIVKKHKKQSKRKEKSLLEMHQSRKQKKLESGSERRPFSREIDLKANYFDEAQKKGILKKAQHLDDRFSSGHAKYL